MGLLDWMKKGKEIAVKDMTPEQLAGYAKNLEASSVELEKQAENLDAREKELDTRADEIAKQEKALDSKKSTSGAQSEPVKQAELTEREKRLAVIAAHFPFNASVRMDTLSDDVIKARYSAACEIRDKSPKVKK
jgi:hypothetical protein